MAVGKSQEQTQQIAMAECDRRENSRKSGIESHEKQPGSKPNVIDVTLFTEELGENHSPTLSMDHG